LVSGWGFKKILLSPGREPVSFKRLPILRLKYTFFRMLAGDFCPGFEDIYAFPSRWTNGFEVI
jgi:hypothetical protein